MPDFIYDPDRLARLEDQFTRQAADIEGDHMTVDELEELKWQRATKAKAVALYKEREAASDEPAPAADILSLGEQLAAMRARHSHRGKLADPNVNRHRQASASSGLDRIKKALAG